MLAVKPLDFDTDGADWPNRGLSRFVDAGGLNWHVQSAGEGPVLLLLHGTAASTHSWRDMIVPLARQFTVIAPDLPSHGFTSAPSSRELSLPSMAQLVAGLLQSLDVSPVLVAGHSAGAAILMRMALDGLITPGGIVSFNGALLPFPGIAGHIFPPLARLLFLNPLAPRVLTFTASRRKVEALLRDTGSRIDERGVDLYARLIANPVHVSGAIGMMANWDLRRLAGDMPRLGLRLLVVSGENDRAVPPADGQRIADLVPRAQFRLLPGLGHLAHEEKPRLATELVRDYAAELALLSQDCP